MGRPKRADEARCTYHMLNRANLRVEIFHKAEDYEAFERLIEEALDLFDVSLFSYCLMPNHWHFVVRPNVDGEMGRFAQWIGLTHTQRYHAHYHSVGMGHLYQGRYKSFPVQNDEHFLTLCRYVERNAFSAKLCREPDQWRYGSLSRWLHGTQANRNILEPWPIARRAKWVRMDFSDSERAQIQWSMARGVPFGNETWVESMARRCGLESTMRPRGRPKKAPK
ncbi:MAG: transposase [Pirellulaceae bacterium]|nr:transposase [Pirellulaceae bacterium]